jgi:hypothetical protein
MPFLPFLYAICNVIKMLLARLGKGLVAVLRIARNDELCGLKEM